MEAPLKAERPKRKEAWEIDKKVLGKASDLEAQRMIRWDLKVKHKQCAPSSKGMTRQIALDFAPTHHPP